MFDATSTTIAPDDRWSSDARLAPVAYAPWPIRARQPALPPPVGAVLLLDLCLCLGIPLGLHRLLGSAPLAPATGSVTVLAAVLTLAFVAAAGGYAPGALFSLRRQAGAVLAGASGAILVIALAATAFGAARMLAAPWCQAALAVPLGLIAGRALVARRIRAESRFAAPTLVVGSPATGARIAQWLHRTGRRDIRIIGCVEDGVTDVPATSVAEPTAGLACPAVLGPIDLAFDLIRQGAVQHVIIPVSAAAAAGLIDRFHRLAQPVQVTLALPLAVGGDRVAGGVAGGVPGGVRLIPLIDPPIAGGWRTVKRIEDIIVASLMLAVLAVPMALAALAIRIDSQGPAVFPQRRVGFAGRAFWMLKFRTMHDHPPEREMRQATPHDPRVTRIGGWLRRRSIDEIPQFVNVLRGEMSVVGPRPHAPGTCAAGRPFEQVAAYYAARHRVRPGVTGLAQVRGFRGGTETEDKLLRRIESDLEYIELWSPWLDLVVLLRTVGCVVGQRNAY
jgi:exopolysaccharide biosynthesis polyprenyl glycosylphosphotransferase